MGQNPGEVDLLWLRLKSGDREAFAALYRMHSIPLIAYGLRLCPDRDILKDQIQELFVELWNSRENLSPTDSVKFYLFRALRNKLIRQEKNHHSHNAIIKWVADRNGTLLDQPVESAIVEKEIHESHVAVLKEALKELTLRQQEVIQLRFYQGFSNQEIADLMDMNYQSVSNLLYKALSRLKEMIRIPVFMSLLLLSCLA
jgi:RNA polymerase sigma factor (sigma-70 family)